METKASNFLIEWFQNEPAGTFVKGHVFRNAPDLTDARERPGMGYWHCDIAKHNQLTWSNFVCSLFGLPPGAQVEREWAVARYSSQSRNILQKVRTYAIDRKLGFILDAEITFEGGNCRWIRMLAVVIVARDRVVGLHGLKRALS